MKIISRSTQEYYENSIRECANLRAKIKTLQADYDAAIEQMEQQCRKIEELNLHNDVLNGTISNNANEYKRKIEEFELEKRGLLNTLRGKEKYLDTLLRGHKCKIDALLKQLKEYEKHDEVLKEFLYSNVKSIPWLAGVISDYLTYDFEILAKKLDWGANQQREKKVASIREIRAEAKRRIEEAKIATYQLEYLKELFPALDDILQTEYTELNYTGEIPEYDPVRKYLEESEWLRLSETERNQLALDRYVESRKKSSWQIGRDYELSVAYEYRKKGYDVITYGSFMGLEDMGRDLIAKRNKDILIIQCKYWAKEKQIHEKHIFQLYGSLVSYGIENGLSSNEITGVFVTNITLSPMAKKVAHLLNIVVEECRPLIDFPRIKCNIGHSETFGIYSTEKIYHLPMDEQYDSTKIDKKGEFYAFTVKEAENAGFRRAYKHYT